MTRPILRPLVAFRPVVLAALTALALGSTALAEEKVLAKVNGEAITAKDVEVALPDVLAEYPNLDAAQGQQITLDFLIEMKAAAQKAKGEKIDGTEEFKRRLAYVRERVMMQELLAKVAKESITDAKVKAFYDEQVKAIKPVEEVRARHVLVENEEDAKKVAARIKAGEDFAKIAKELSKDPGSGVEGGDLGYFTKERMVPEFAEAAFAAKVGDVTAPVKSQFGWHVIKVEDRRTKPAPAFEQVKDRIAQGLAAKAQGEYVKKLREEAKVEKTEAPKAPETKAPEAPKAPEKK